MPARIRGPKNNVIIPLGNVQELSLSPQVHGMILIANQFVDMDLSATNHQTTNYKDFLKSYY